MSTDPRLLAVATAVPDCILTRDEVARSARRLFGGRPDIDRMMAIYANSGVEARRSCVPLEWYLRPHGWRDRHALFFEHALALAERATTACLEKAGLRPEAVDAVVCVSTTGMAAPSLEAHLAERLPFRPDVARLPVFGLGCAGGVLGLSRAAMLARADPGSRVLLIVVELCGLTFRPNDPSKSNLVATALFGDGAAALLVGGEGDGPRITAGGEHRWPESLDVMGWHIEDDGFGVLFSRDIPALVRGGFRRAVDGFLERRGMLLTDLDGFLCHPGGAKVVAALEDSLELPAGTLDIERAVLRDYGNMSAVTVLFVLERALERGLGGRRLMTALGPGFTAAFQMLEG